MGKKKEKKAKRPPVGTALDFRARERSAEAQTEAAQRAEASAPDGVSGSWQ
jgi:hypothetical protein